jgi:hypothetical protein
VTVYPVQSDGGLQLFLGNLSPRESTARVTLPQGTGGSAAPGAAEVTVIGAAAGSRAEASRAEASSADDGDGDLTVTLGPWATAVVTFRA